MLGRKPTASEQRHMDFVGDMFCIACEKDGLYNSHILLHHVNGRTRPGAHLDVLPLCAPHHQHDDTDPMGRIGIHPWKKRFENMYGTSEQLLIEIKRRIEVRNGSN